MGIGAHGLIGPLVSLAVDQAVPRTAPATANRLKMAAPLSVPTLEPGLKLETVAMISAPKVGGTFLHFLTVPLVNHISTPFITQSEDPCKILSPFLVHSTFTVPLQMVNYSGNS